MPRPPHTPVSRTLDFPFIPADSFVDSIEKVLNDVKQVLVAEHFRCSGIADVGNVNSRAMVMCEDSLCHSFTQTPFEWLTLTNTSDLSHRGSYSDVDQTDSPKEERRDSIELGERLSHDSRINVLEELKDSLEADADIQDFAAMQLIATLKRAGSSASFVKVSRRIQASLTWISEHRLEAFDSFMSFVIMLNAIAIAMSCDTSDWLGWIAVDTIFMLFFLIEFIVKLMLLGVAGYFCGQDWKWSWFESFLLLLAIAEVVIEVLHLGGFSGTAAFRILRLIRLSKLTRIWKFPFIQELVLMIDGVVGGVRTLSFSILLIAIPLFILSILLRETLGREEGMKDGSQMFSSLPKSFFSMFRCVVAGDCADDDGRPIFVLVSSRYGWAYGCIYGMTIVLMTFGLFNVIVAIYVDNTVAAAKYNDVKKTENRLRDQEMFKEKAVELAMLVYSFKMNQSVGSIQNNGIDFEELKRIELSPAEFVNVCRNPAFSKLLADLDVAEENQKDLFDNLDADHGGTLDIGEIITGITKLRGDARKADIVGVALVARHISATLAKFREETLEMLQQNNRFLLSACPLLQNSNSQMCGSAPA